MKGFFTNLLESSGGKQVAEAVGKEHHKLLRDVRTYCGYLTELNFQLSDFFIESTYTTISDRELHETLEVETCYND